MRRLILAAAVAAVFGIPAGAQAAPGDLDPSFGDSGVTRTHIGAADSFDRADAVALDASGRIIVAGTTSTPIGDDELVIVRYLADGSLDPTFGAGGIVKSDAGAPGDVAVDSLGRIVVAGYGQEGAETGVMVARFLSTGAPDTSFGGGDGVAIKDFTGEFDSAAAVAVDGSGRIVIAGGAPYALVARFLENGAVDTTFGGGDGYVAETLPTDAFSIHGLRDLALDSAGRIVVVSGGFAAMRFTASGALDMSFGGDDGVVTHRVESGDEATAVAIDAAGRVLVGGRTGNAIEEPIIDGYDFAVVRYSESGVLDTEFGDGESMAVADGGIADYATDLALDANGRIVLGGAGEGFAVARFLPSGRISGSFGGGDGVVMTNVDEHNLGTAVAVDANGRIVLAGNAEGEETEGNTFSDFAVLRYEGGPVVDVLHALSVQIAGEGEGTVSGLGIECEASCTETYDAGTIVTLTATPADELAEVPSIFTGWSGACSGEAETCELTMSEAREVTATFEPTFGWEEEPPVEEEPPTEEPPSSPPPTSSPPPPAAIVTAPAPPSSSPPKRRKCRKGFVKRKARGKVRCVKRKGRRHR
jgi:uncharacterized delta-60 repeat protein